MFLRSAVSLILANTCIYYRKCVLLTYSTASSQYCRYAETFINFTKFVSTAFCCTARSGSADIVNPSDIASFYKEQLANESGTYVQERAAASGKSVSDVLRDTVVETAAAVRNANDALQGAREKEAWSSFVQGFFCFHFWCKRYRLDELGLF